MIQVRKAGSRLLAAVLVAGAVLVVQPGTASAHCDSAQGPVVGGALKALETGEIKWALAYVQPAAEPEMKAAFNHALEVRKLGGKAQELADQFFAETTVRLHRIGEGASYTGIDHTPEITPGLHAAEEAVKTGDATEVTTVLNEAVKEGIEQFWHQVVAARERAEKEGTVEALREQATAELIFEKFVYGVELAAQGLAEGEEGSAAGGHAHGAPAESGHAHGVPAGSHGAEVSGAVRIHLNGHELAATGVAVDGAAMVPLRAVIEALGGQVTWDAATDHVTVTVGAKELVLQVGNPTGHLNGSDLTLPMAPALHEGITLVPGHLVAEFLGLEFKWDADQGLVEYAGH